MKTFTQAMQAFQDWYFELYNEEPTPEIKEGAEDFAEWLDEQTDSRFKLED